MDTPAHRIRGLTLTHPWAFAVSRLGKDVENRTWSPARAGLRPGDFLAIHGGVVPTGAKRRAAEADLRAVLHLTGLTGTLNPRWTARLNRAQRAWLAEWGRQHPVLDDFFVPGIVAVARLGQFGPVPDAYPSLWSAAGQHHWPLVEVLTLEQPIPHRGAQGAWKVQDQALSQLRAAWQHGSPVRTLLPLEHPTCI